MATVGDTRTAGWLTLLQRAWEALAPAAHERAPDYGPSAPLTGPARRRLELERTRLLLEQTREVVADGGWCGGGSWFVLRQPDGSTRPATLEESFALRSPTAPVAGACLVGIMIRLADDPDLVPTVDDVWRATDELYEAMQERCGHESLPPGRAYPLSERRGRLRGLTAWNDEPQRTRADVLDLIDRAITRTIVGAVTDAGR